MIKFLKYLIQSFVVLIFYCCQTYWFKFSRRLFSNIFEVCAVFKSKKIIDNNILKYKKIFQIMKKKVFTKCGKIMEKLLLNMYFR